MNSRNHYENLPVFKAVYALLLDVHKFMPQLSRDIRYSLGEGLVKLLMNVIVLIYEANLTQDKHPMLMRARKLVVEIKVTMRIFSDMHQISEKRYLQLAQQAESVSKQLTAWDNSQFRKNNNLT